MKVVRHDPGWSEALKDLSRQMEILFRKKFPRKRIRFRVNRFSNGTYEAEAGITHPSYEIGEVGWKLLFGIIPWWGFCPLCLVLDYDTNGKMTTYLDPTVGMEEEIAELIKELESRYSDMDPYCRLELAIPSDLS